jgi:hypothetical protein
MEIIYKSNQENQTKEAWVWIDRVSYSEEKRKRF